MRTRDIVAMLLLAAGLAAPIHSQTDGSATDDATWQRYQHIISTSTLEWSPTQPFLLKVDYQLYDLNGKPGVSGTAEESWTQTDGRRIHIHSPSIHVGDDSSADRAKTFTRESYLVSQAIRAIARPFPSATERKDFAMGEFRQPIGGSDVRCFSLVVPGTARKPDAPAYCTDIDNHIVAMIGSWFVLERSDFREFRGHQIPAELKLSYENKPALTMHVTELDPLPDTPLKSNTKPIAVTAEQVPAETIAALALKHKGPSYPGLARAAHIKGTVILIAAISKEGLITDLDALASPDAILTKSAEDAVRKWTYQPYILNGTPTELETTIMVNYSIGDK